MKEFLDTEFESRFPEGIDRLRIGCVCIYIPIGVNRHILK